MIDVHENGITIDERFCRDIGALPRVTLQMQPFALNRWLLNAFTD
jgi:hypothetical protein